MSETQILPLIIDGSEVEHVQFFKWMSTVIFEPPFISNPWVLNSSYWHHHHYHVVPGHVNRDIHYSLAIRIFTDYFQTSMFPELSH